jgi:hypothetical protein
MDFESIQNSEIPSRAGFLFLTAENWHLFHADCNHPSGKAKYRLTSAYGKTKVPVRRFSGMSLAGRFLPPTINSRASGVCRSLPPRLQFSASAIGKADAQNRGTRGSKVLTGHPAHKSERQSVCRNMKLITRERVSAIGLVVRLGTYSNT